MREAVSDLAAGRSERGFNRLVEFGAIQEIEKDSERLKKLAEKYLQAVRSGKTSMIVSPTHAEARVFASGVRRELTATGLIEAEERVFERLENLNWTEAEKRDAVNYMAGQIVEFHRMTKGAVRGGRREPKFLSGEQRQVKSRAAGSVIIERNGAEKGLPLSQAENFSVYQTEKLALSLGDRVRITKNFVIRDMEGKSRCRNDDVHTVTAINDDGIRLSNGVSLKTGRWHLDQGLVVTSHAAQGKTVDQVLVSVPVRTFSQVNEAQWYVSLSRARAAMFVFTDSLLALKEAVTRPSGRLSAHELLGQIRDLAGHRSRFSPGLETGLVPERRVEKIPIQRNR